MSLHRETFVSLVRQHRWTRGAELGVDKGVLFGMLLGQCPLLVELIGVDTFPSSERSHRVPQIVDRYGSRARILAMTTHDASETVENGSLDFVFIDADHSEEAVSDDIACWRPKVRTGGWIGGHDYNDKFPGVRRAVDRAFGEHVGLWPGSIWGAWQ